MYLTLPLKGFSLDLGAGAWAPKTRMMGLLDPERSLTISSAVWIQYQWCRSVVKSEGVRVTSHSLRSSHQTKSRPKFVFGSENGLFGRFRFFFSFSVENEFSSLFYFSFSFQKCHLR